MAKRWVLRVATLVVWATAGLTASFWALRFVGSGVAAPSAAMALEPATVEPVDLANVLGPAPAPASAASADVAGTPKPVDPATRFALVGVVAGRANAGVALISIEGRAARPYQVGSRIEGSYTLKSVASKSATLVPSAKTDEPFTLQLAAPGRAGTASTAPIAAPPTGTAPSGSAATRAAPGDDDSTGAAPPPVPVPSPRLRQRRPAPGSDVAS